jgi:hypothetical protein
MAQARLLDVGFWGGKLDARPGAGNDAHDPTPEVGEHRKHQDDDGYRLSFAPLASGRGLEHGGSGLTFRQSSLWGSHQNSRSWQFQELHKRL